MAEIGPGTGTRDWKSGLKKHAKFVEKKETWRENRETNG